MKEFVIPIALKDLREASVTDQYTVSTVLSQSEIITKLRSFGKDIGSTDDGIMQFSDYFETVYSVLVNMEKLEYTVIAKTWCLCLKSLHFLLKFLVRMFESIQTSSSNEKVKYRNIFKMVLYSCLKMFELIDTMVQNKPKMITKRKKCDDWSKELYGGDPDAQKLVLFAGIRDVMQAQPQILWPTNVIDQELLGVICSSCFRLIDVWSKSTPSVALSNSREAIYSIIICLVSQHNYTVSCAMMCSNALQIGGEFAPNIIAALMSAGVKQVGTVSAFPLFTTVIRECLRVCSPVGPNMENRGLSENALRSIFQFLSECSINHPTALLEVYEYVTEYLDDDSHTVRSHTVVVYASMIIELDRMIKTAAAEPTPNKRTDASSQEPEVTVANDAESDQGDGDNGDGEDFDSVERLPRHRKVVLRNTLIVQMLEQVFDKSAHVRTKVFNQIRRCCGDVSTDDAGPASTAASSPAIPMNLYTVAADCVARFLGDRSVLVRKQAIRALVVLLENNPFCRDRTFTRTLNEIIQKTDIASFKSKVEALLKDQGPENAVIIRAELLGEREAPAARKSRKSQTQTTDGSQAPSQQQPTVTIPADLLKEKHTFQFIKDYRNLAEVFVRVQSTMRQLFKSTSATDVEEAIAFFVTQRGCGFDPKVELLPFDLSSAGGSLAPRRKSIVDSEDSDSDDTIIPDDDDEKEEVAQKNEKEVQAALGSDLVLMAMSQADEDALRKKYEDAFCGLYLTLQGPATAGITAQITTELLSFFDDLDVDRADVEIAAASMLNRLSDAENLPPKLVTYLWAKHVNFDGSTNLVDDCKRLLHLMLLRCTLTEKSRLQLTNGKLTGIQQRLAELVVMLRVEKQRCEMTVFLEMVRQVTLIVSILAKHIPPAYNPASIFNSVPPLKLPTDDDFYEQMTEILVEQFEIILQMDDIEKSRSLVFWSCAAYCHMKAIFVSADHPDAPVRQFLHRCYSAKEPDNSRGIFKPGFIKLCAVLTLMSHAVCLFIKFLDGDVCLELKRRNRVKEAKQNGGGEKRQKSKRGVDDSRINESLSVSRRKSRANSTMPSTEKKNDSDEDGFVQEHPATDLEADITSELIEKMVLPPALGDRNKHPLPAQLCRLAVTILRQCEIHVKLLPLQHDEGSQGDGHNECPSLLKSLLFACARLATMGCLANYKFAMQHLSVVTRVLAPVATPSMRVFMLTFFHDVALRYPQLFTSVAHHVYARLGDPCLAVRLTAIKLLSLLVLHQVILVKPEMCRLVVCVADKEAVIREEASNVLRHLSEKADTLFSLFPDFISHLCQSGAEIDENCGVDDDEDSDSNDDEGAENTERPLSQAVSTAPTVVSRGQTPDLGEVLLIVRLSLEDKLMIIDKIVEYIQKDKLVHALAMKLVERLVQAPSGDAARVVAHALARLPLNGKCFQPISSQVQRYSDKLSDDMVYRSFCQAVDKMKPSPFMKKVEKVARNADDGEATHIPLKQALEEFQKEIDGLHTRGAVVESVTKKATRKTNTSFSSTNISMRHSTMTTPRKTGRDTILPTKQSLPSVPDGDENATPRPPTTRKLRGRQAQVLTEARNRTTDVFESSDPEDEHNPEIESVKPLLESSQTNTSQEEEVEVDDEQPIKKRGRPKRKVDTVQPLLDSSQPNTTQEDEIEEEQPTKKRGRPKKRMSDSSPTVAPEKAPRTAVKQEAVIESTRSMRTRRKVAGN